MTGKSSLGCFSPFGHAALLLIAVAAGSIASPASGSCTRKVEAVRQVERQWLDAYEKNDATAMHAILADDFMITHFDASVQTKRDVVQSVREASGRSAAKYVTEAVAGRCYGETVILAGWIVEDDGDRARYTDTYVRIGGRWRVAASHLSRARTPR